MELEEEQRLIHQEHQTSQMKETAMFLAATLGVNLKPGVSSRGAGDCLIEACVDQFLRPEFELLDELEPQYWREKMVDMMKDNEIAYKTFKPVKGKGTKKKQWTNDWAKLMQTGQFDCQAGDLMAPALALVFQRNILVFNTDPGSLNSITVHLPTQLGGSASTNAPILLCYGNSHYEGLLPESYEDTQKTLQIIEQYQSNNVSNLLEVKCSVPRKKQTQKINNPSTTSSLMHNFLQLSNTGQNFCFVNSVLQLLDVTDIKPFLLSNLPLQRQPQIATAQELGRLYRATGGRESAEVLLR